MRFREIIEAKDDRPFDTPERATKRREVIGRILRLLDTHPKLASLKDRTRVFGSVAAGDATPGDIDLMVDFSDYTGPEMWPTHVAPDTAYLLGLAKKYYGLVDVFVMVGNMLWVRSDDASSFILAKRAASIWKVGKIGRPVADVAVEWQTGAETPNAP